jgi:hypothetical protein
MTMLKQNNIWIGIILGLIIPFVSYAVLLTLQEMLQDFGILSVGGINISLKTRTLWLIAICLNLFPFQWYNKLKAVESMRGMMIGTFAYILFWIIKFSGEVF